MKAFVYTALFVFAVIILFALGYSIGSIAGRILGV
jgi:hypothetical protein